MNDIAHNLEAVNARIAAACARAGRDPAAVTLIAVTKTWPVEVLVAAHAAGLRHFGENRTHELEAKVPALAKALEPDHGVTWHFIGALQSRQTGVVADLADSFHAMDRMKIARRLSRQLEENGRAAHHPLPYFLEVNISGEASKHGFNCENWEKDATQRDKLRTVVETIQQLAGLHLAGLMTMAPWGAEDQVVSTVFKRTRQLADWLAAELEIPPLQLSMGMTDDFELAIAAGATHIRVGRAIFGERQT